MRVEVRALSRDDSLALVARHHVGRYGIGLHDLIRVELMAYVYADDWIYTRVPPGEDVAILERHAWAAFEVDEIDGVYDWRSVELTGRVELLTPETNEEPHFTFDQAVSVLRNAVPAILTADDPLPDRVRLLRIHVDTVRGRQSRTVDGDAPHPRA